MVKKRKFAILAVIFIGVIFWIIRYRSLNGMYQELCNESREEYSKGIVVDCGSNYLNKDALLEGCSVCVNSYTIKDFSEFTESYGISENEIIPQPQKIALVEVTFSCQGKDTVVIPVNEFGFHSLDNYAGMDWDILLLLNPVLNDEYTLHISPGDCYDLVLPFDLFETYFAKDSWEQLEALDYVLHITSYPVEKDIYLS